MLKAIARRALPAGVRQAVGHWLRVSRDAQPAMPTSYGYEVAEPGVVLEPLLGWHDDAVAQRQDAMYRALIQQMYLGQPREDLLVAAEAIRCTGLESPSILEVGCGSGYYSEILSHVLRHPVRYVGLDYSQTMIRLARERHADLPFLVADATALPFTDGSFDIILNGVSLMHILRYEAAIAESRRVAHRWCIFHTVPVLQRRDTTFLRKKAYGQPTIEIIFNEEALLSLLVRCGLFVRHVLDSIPYNLEAALGEPTVTKTYVCEVRSCGTST